MSKSTTLNPHLQEIDSLTRLFADAHGSLEDVVADLTNGIEELKRNYMARVKTQVARTAERHAALKAAIEAHPELWEKPRTVTLHGIKVGMQKAKGSIQIEDPERTLDLIRKHLPEMEDDLIAATYYPDKTAIADLTVADARRIGCTIHDATDVPVIKPADSEVDKVVRKLLADATTEEEG